MKNLSGICCFVLLIFLSLSAVAEQPLYSKFKAVRGQATGHIHIEKIDDRYWFIDAHGYAFFPVGLDHTKFFGNTVDLVSQGKIEDTADHSFNILGKLNINTCASLSHKCQKDMAGDKGFSYCQNIFPSLIPHGSFYKNPDKFRADPFSVEYDE